MGIIRLCSGSVGQILTQGSKFAKVSIFTWQGGERLLQHLAWQWGHWGPLGGAAWAARQQCLCHEPRLLLLYRWAA